IAPVPLGFARIARGALELLHADVGSITAELGIIGKLRPRDGEMVVSHSEKTAETYHRIGYLAAALVYHHPFDGADFLIAGTIHAGSFYLVTSDQIVCFAFFCGHRRL